MSNPLVVVFVHKDEYHYTEQDDRAVSYRPNQTEITVIAYLDEDGPAIAGVTVDFARDPNFRDDAREALAWELAEVVARRYGTTRVEVKRHLTTVAEMERG